MHQLSLLTPPLFAKQNWTLGCQYHSQFSEAVVKCRSRQRLKYGTLSATFAQAGAARIECLGHRVQRIFESVCEISLY